jgi:cytochrome c oxidase cbb3-type subunit IV
MTTSWLPGLVTGMLLLLFLLGICWAWSPRRRAAFEAAARLPLDEHRMAPQTATEDSR